MLTKFVLPLAVAASLLPAYSATVTTYTNLEQAVFNQGFVASAATIDFTGAPTWNGTPAGINWQSVNFLSSPGDTVTFEPVSGDPRYWGTGRLLIGSGQTAALDSFLRIILPLSVNAVSMNVMTNTPVGGQVLVGLGSGTAVPVSTTTHPSTPTWVAFTSDETFNTIYVRGGAANIVPMLDNLTYGNFTAQVGGGGQEPPTETPEAATFILIGTGLAALRFFRRKPVTI
jgi:hypothetical protein